MSIISMIGTFVKRLTTSYYEHMNPSLHPESYCWMDLANSKESWTTREEYMSRTGLRISASHLAIACCALPTMDSMGRSGIGVGLCALGTP